MSGDRGAAMFDRKKVRLLKVAGADAGAAVFDAVSDVDWLLSFIGAFEKLGWIPPATKEEQTLLHANDFLVHKVDGCTFYEFWVRGGRDDRLPPLTLFFHLDVKGGIVRILGIFLTNDVRNRRSEIRDLIYARAEMVDIMLSRR
jgi:hypothetical protein